MSWTDERIERLKKMWAEGATASQIADELGGVSRNAVIGKAHRLGLEQRPSPVKPGEEKEAKKPRRRGARCRRAESRAQGRSAQARCCGCRHDGFGSAAVRQPAALRAGNAVSLDRPRRLHPPGSRRSAGADPAGPAAPPGAGQAEPRGRRQDQPARSQRPHLQLADGPSRRARLPFLRPGRRTPASLIASSIAASPIRRSCRAATAVRRRRCRSAVRASAKLEPPSAAKPARSAA